MLTGWKVELVPKCLRPWLPIVPEYLSSQTIFRYFPFFRYVWGLLGIEGRGHPAERMVQVIRTTKNLYFVHWLMLAVF